MKAKKILIFLVPLVYAQNDMFDMDFSFDDDFAEVTANNMDEINLIARQNNQSDCPLTDPVTILSLISGVMGQNVLPFNLYNFTNPPVIRSLHDLPSLRPWYGCGDRLCMYGTLFLNDMPSAFFNKCDTTIGEYLSISEEDSIIQEFQNIIDELGLTLNIPAVLPLFNIARLQQHRLGAMLGLSKCFGNVRINGAIPLYYLAYNFFLNQEEVDALNASPFFAGQDVGYQVEDPNTFINRHLVADKFGLGDLRLYLDYLFLSDTDYPIRIGGMLTLPNNTIFRSAIVGNNFSKCWPGPNVNFQQIFQTACLAQGSDTDPLTLVAQNNLATLKQTFALMFLDKLSATVLENSLGQNQISFGFLGEATIPLTRYSGLRIFFEWDHFIKDREDRPTRMLITPADVAAQDFKNLDPNVAQANLEFIQQRLLNIGWPPDAHFKIRQGDIIKARIYSVTNWRVFQWDIGYDFWYQRKEHLELCCPVLVPLGTPDVHNARKSAALQSKLFGHMNIQKHADEYQLFGWKLGLKAEGTVQNIGMGKDWLVAFEFVADF